MDDASLARYRAEAAEIWDPRQPTGTLPAGVTPAGIERRLRSVVWRHGPTGTWWRAFRHAVGFRLLTALEAVMRSGALTGPVRQALSGLIAALPLRRRDVALANLQRAFPQASDGWRRDTWRRFVRSATDVLLAAMDLETATPADTIRRVELRGAEHLREACAGGRGAVCITAHFGAFPLLFARLAAGGWAVAAIVKRQRDPQFEQWWLRLSDTAGLVSIPDQPPLPAASLAMDWLHDGGLLAVAADQRAPGDAPLIPFFGHDVHTYPIPARLALRTRCAFVPMFIHPPDPATHGAPHVAEILPPIEPPAGATSTAAVRHLLTAYHRELERQIRITPWAWWWVHKRFHRWN